MFTLILIVMVCMVLHVLSLQGRRNQPGMEALRGWYYAHRGLHDAEKPENSMAAFAAAVEKGYGVELDVHLLKDGTLAVIHDSDLSRTTGQTGRVEDLTAEELRNYRLQGSEQTIPELGQGDGIVGYSVSCADAYSAGQPLEVPLYFQTDYPDALYGEGTVATDGCGITSLAMVATALTGHTYLPDELAE